MSQDSPPDFRENERRRHSVEVVFYIDDDVMVARSIDVSDTGVRIETEDPIDIRVQIKVDDRMRVIKGKLVWAQKKYDGGSCYGIRYND